MFEEVVPLEEDPPDLVDSDSDNEGPPDLVASDSEDDSDLDTDVPFKEVVLEEDPPNLVDAGFDDGKILDATGSDDESGSELTDRDDENQVFALKKGNSSRDILSMLQPQVGITAAMLDSGATAHASFKKPTLDYVEYTVLTELSTASGEPLRVLGKGTMVGYIINIWGQAVRLEIPGVLYVPDLTHTLISAVCLVDRGAVTNHWPATMLNHSTGLYLMTWATMCSIVLKWTSRSICSSVTLQTSYAVLDHTTHNSLRSWLDE